LDESDELPDESLDDESLDDDEPLDDDDESLDDEDGELLDEEKCDELFDEFESESEPLDELLLPSQHRPLTPI